MNHLAQAIADTYAYYVGQNDDLEGFFSDLAIMIQETEGYPADLPECLEAKSAAESGSGRGRRRGSMTVNNDRRAAHDHFMMMTALPR